MPLRHLVWVNLLNVQVLLLRLNSGHNMGRIFVGWIKERKIGFCNNLAYGPFINLSFEAIVKDGGKNNHRILYKDVMFVHCMKSKWYDIQCCWSKFDVLSIQSFVFISPHNFVVTSLIWQMFQHHQINHNHFVAWAS